MVDFTKQGMPIIRRSIVQQAVAYALETLAQEGELQRTREAFERQGPLGRQVMLANAKLRLASLAGKPLPPSMVGPHERQVPT